MGFDPRNLAIPVRRSNQLSYAATDVGSWSFVSSNEPVKNGCEVICEMFHIYWTADLKSRVQTPLKSWLFQASLRNCLNCIHYCNDHSSLDRNNIAIFPSCKEIKRLEAKTEIIVLKELFCFSGHPSSGILTCKWKSSNHVLHCKFFWPTLMIPFEYWFYFVIIEHCTLLEMKNLGRKKPAYIQVTLE